jgi:glycine dehydrogenase subunit 1
LTRYTSTTESDRREMLAAIGVSSIEELFAEIPASLRLDGPLRLPDGMSEQEVFDHLSLLAARNRHADEEITFLGAGMYDHYLPALIDSITQRSEFLTPYTPYQPEISQGGLQVMFEFQTAISELTGLPVANASLYEGPSSVASAGYLARTENGRSRFVASRGVHPHSRETLETYSAGFGATVQETPLDDRGATDPEALAAAVDEDTAAVFLQQPNFLGTVEDLGALTEAAKRTGALVVCAADPLTLGILRPPGDFGVDVCVGEGQTLGNRLDFGGPSFGFFAAAERYIRKMPGRIAGETVDVDGRRGFVLTLQTREQHIRREKATHNICTAQALNALAGIVYLSWLGRRGIVELGELMLRRTAYAREALGAEPINAGPVVREFAVRVPDLDGLFERARAEGVNPGYRLGESYPEYEDGLLVAITERRTREDIDRLAKLVTAAREEVAGPA